MPSTSKTIPTKNQKQFDHVYWSFLLLKTSILELQIFSRNDFNKSEISILNSHTMSFYKVTLQYCLIMEYSKLMEFSSSAQKQGLSSLMKLNDLTLIYQDEFKPIYDLNIQKLNELKSSPFYIKIKRLRDKKFAHSDSNIINKAFNISALSLQELNMGLNQLLEIKKIIDSCSFIFDFEYSNNLSSVENRTENFILNQGKYKEYFFSKNYNL
jgi:hypothetical protein